MKVLLLYFNRHRALAAPPIGLSIVASSVAAEHHVELVDLLWEKDPVGAALGAVRSLSPDVVGISLRNLDNQDSRSSVDYVRGAKALVEAIRRVTDAPIVLGGTAFTTMPEEILELLGADFGISGPGEGSFPRLVKGIGSGHVDTALPGLVYRKDGAVIANPPGFHGYPAAFTPERMFYDASRYRRSFWPSVVLTKTGCHFRCVYCEVRLTMGSHFLLRDPEVICAELEYHAKKLGIRSVFLVDTCFNHPADYAKDVLRAIARRKLRMFLGASVRPDGLDEEMVSLMKEAGIFFVSLGADTLSDRTLRSYRKGFTMKEVAESCRLLERYDIGYMLELVLGGPGETVDTVEESLAFLTKVRPALFLLNAGFRVLPGTELYDIARREGVFETKRDLLAPTFYFSKDVSPDWLHRRIARYYRRYGYRQIRTPWLFVVRRAAHLWFGRGG